MSWDDLSWLTNYGYERLHASDGPHRETWILRGLATRRLNQTEQEIIIADTEEDTGEPGVEISAGLCDDNLCLVQVSIDRISFDKLRKRLEWYERRVLRMLAVGLDLCD